MTQWRAVMTRFGAMSVPLQTPPKRFATPTAKLCAASVSFEPPWMALAR
jgi:hypothetical protein